MVRHLHEFRDPIHAFVSLRGDERKIIGSRAFQRLRHIHQLALTYLVYPGASHKRFEHSLGVMDLATKIFDTVTAEQNIRHDEVRRIIPDKEALQYWKSVVRAAALCHDIGHLPFSHAAEAELLPEGYDHERLTIDLIKQSDLAQIWPRLIPPLKPEHIIKVAVGPKKARDLEFTSWETILSEMITGDSFGADRMDYLLRDSHHVGVAYGHYDHFRLIQCLAILPRLDKQSDEPALGLTSGGVEASEGLMLARHFMFKQVYFHPVRRAFDIHLKEFLKEWLAGGFFPIAWKEHLKLSDAEVLSAIRSATLKKSAKGHKHAVRIDRREHFRLLYRGLSSDKSGGILLPGEVIAKAASDRFGEQHIRYDYVAPKTSAPDFPVLTHEGKIESSIRHSEVLARLPVLEVDSVYCDVSIRADAENWRDDSKAKLLNLEKVEGAS